MRGLAVVTFKWKRQGYRSEYEAGHVNRLAEKFRRFLSLDHEFVCITDDPKGLDPHIRPVEMWSDYADVPNPNGAHEPACYRRLKLFSAEMADLIAPRIIATDLDMVPTGDLTPLFDRPEDTVLLATDHPKIPINGSLAIITPGARQEVWDSFDPETSPALAQKALCYGSDQGWMAYCLRDKVPTWRPGENGLYFFNQLEQSRMRGKLPKDARLVSFHGPRDPWGAGPQRLAWVREHYPLPVTDFEEVA